MKKTSKKVIALFLSVLMLLTAIPMSVFATQSDSDDPSQDKVAKNLMTAIEKFETKMDGTIYKNMSSAYATYVNAYKAYDSYVYGGADVDMKGYTDALNALTDDATGTLEVWLSNDGLTYGGPTGQYIQNKNLTKIYAADTASNSMTNNYYNLLWSETNYSTARYSVTSDKNDSGDYRAMTAYFYYPQVVLMYTGVSGQLCGSTAVFQINGTLRKNKTRYIQRAYPYMGGAEGGASMFEFGQWTGTMLSSSSNSSVPSAPIDCNASLAGAYNLSAVNSEAGFNAAGGAKLLCQRTGGVTAGYTYILNSYAFACAWKYDGSALMSDNKTYDSFVPRIYYRTSSENGYRVEADGNDMDMNPTDNTSNRVYIVNYERLINAVKAKKDYLQFDSESKSKQYRYGGAEDTMAAFDAITGYDPNSDFTNATSASAYSTCVNNITTKINAFNTATATAPVNDNDESYVGYNDLRDAIKARRVDYLEAEAENHEGIAEDVWNGFAGPSGVYTVATGIFNDASGLYDDDDTAATAAAALQAYDLYTGKVDTTALELSISEALYAINKSSYFADDGTLAALQSAVNTAKAAVWGSVANYGKQKYKLVDSATAQDTVATQVRLVNAAIGAISINTQAESVVYMASLEYALQYAGRYDVTRYSNGSDLSEVKSQVQTYINTISQRQINSVVKNCVQNKIDEYLALIALVYNTIDNLKLAFSEIDDGAFASNGTTGSVDANHPTSGLGVSQRDIGLKFQKNSGQIIFRKTHTDLNKSLGTAEFFFRNAAGGNTVLDSISINDTYDNRSEINVSQSGLFSSDVDDPSDLSSSQISTLNGSISHEAALYNSTKAKNDGAKITLSGIRMTAGGDGDTIATILTGTDSSGNLIIDNIGTDVYASGGYDMTNAFKQIDRAAYPSLGAKLGDGVTDSFVSAMMAYIPASSEAVTLTANTKPFKVEYTTQNKYVGCVYSWYINDKLLGLASARAYKGWAHTREAYTQSFTVIDTSYLFDLWDLCATAAENNTGYTTASYDAFTSALRASKENFAYGTMTADAIVSELQSRYTTLWNAYNALALCADNSVLQTAANNARATYIADNGSAPDKTYSDATWQAFVTAYHKVDAALNGTNYSDVDSSIRNMYSTAVVREHANTETEFLQGMADLAAELNAAKNNLHPVIKLAPIYVATEQILDYIAGTGKTYTTDSLTAVANKLASDYPLLTTYTNDVTEIDYTAAQYNERVNEVNGIYSADGGTVTSDLLALLEESSIDNTAFEAAKTYAASQVDPDAYAKYEQIMAAIDAMTTTTDVQMFKSFTIGTTTHPEITLAGVNFDSQAEADAAPAALIEAMNDLVTYTITVDGTPYTDANHTDGKFAYGEEVTITKDKSTGWYYTYTSVTSSNGTEKYLGNTAEQTFIVKGNTVFRTQDTESESACKVQYIKNNNTLGRIYNIEYLPAGTKITLPAAPSLAFYDFTDYTIDGDSYAAGDTYTVTDKVNIYANYEVAADDQGDEYAYTVTIYNLAGTANKSSFASSGTAEVDAKYNDQISLSQADLTSDKNTIKAKILKNGQYEELKSGRRINSKTDPIVAWAVIPESKKEAWDTGMDDDFQVALSYNTEYIVHYGDSYTFNVCEDTFLIPLTEDWMQTEIDEQRLNTGVIDENGVTVTNKTELIDNDTKFSMIGQFALPEGATLVEAGMLFNSGTDINTLDTDLSLGKAGKNGIMRLKSSKQTAGNQYVISMRKSGFVAGEIVAYQAYVIYEISDGNGGTKQVILYSEAPVITTAIV